MADITKRRLSRGGPGGPHVPFAPVDDASVDDNGASRPAADRIAVAVPPRDRADTLLLVVGRGTNDPDANSNIAKLARMLWEGMRFGWAEAAFSGVAHPRVDAALERGGLAVRCRQRGEDLGELLAASSGDGAHQPMARTTSVWLWKPVIPRVRAISP